jgi:hypothetical protein
MAAAGTAIGVGLCLVAGRDVVVSGALFLVAAGCVLGAAAVTRRRRERRYRSIDDRPLPELPRRTRRLPGIIRGRAQWGWRTGDNARSIWVHYLTSSAPTDLQFSARARTTDATGMARIETERRVIIRKAPEHRDQ